MPRCFVSQAHTALPDKAAIDLRKRDGSDAVIQPYIETMNAKKSSRGQATESAQTHGMETSGRQGVRMVEPTGT
jgi:hypothetical protein